MNDLIEYGPGHTGAPTDGFIVPDNTHQNYYTGMSRDKLIDEHKAMLANLTITQKRCTELLEETRKHRREDREQAKADELFVSLDYFQQQAQRTSAPMAKEPPSTVTEHVLMAAMGCAGEGGEVVDLVKKIRFHGRPFVADEIVEEIGDVLWYVADMASALGIRLSEVARKNVAKLERRYPNGFEVRQKTAAAKPVYDSRGEIIGYSVKVMDGIVVDDEDMGDPLR